MRQYWAVQHATDKNRAGDEPTSGKQKALTSTNNIKYYIIKLTMTEPANIQQCLLPHTLPATIFHVRNV